MSETTTDAAEELVETRILLHAALAEAKCLQIQLGYLRTELVEARSELREFTDSRIEVAV